MNSLIEGMQMKRIILLILALLLISSASMAQLPPVGWIGIFADDQFQGPDQTPIFAYCDFEGAVARAEMWIWCLPSERGQIGADFTVAYHDLSILAPSTVTTNDGIVAVVTGDLENGISILYKECQYGWNWCIRQTIYIISHELAWIEIVEDPGITPKFRNCEEGWPTEQVYKWPRLYLNYVSDVPPYLYCIQPIGTDDSSWGAIKSLYRE